MSFTPEQIEVLKEMFSAQNESTNTAISGLAKRLTQENQKTIDAKLDAKLSAFEEKLGSFQPFDETKQADIVQAALNKVLEDLAATDDTTPPGDNGAGDSPAIAEWKRQQTARDAEQAKIMEQLKQRLLSAETTASEERENRLKIAEQQRIAGMEEGVLTNLRGKVRGNAERDFLNLLRTNNLLVEEGDQLVVKSKDQHGFDVNLPIDKALPDLLKDRFSYMAEVRPGTGTGNPGGGNSGTGNPAPAGKFFNGGNQKPSDAELMAAMSDPSKSAELFAELSQLSA
jgi:hypothetical protein